MADKKKAESAKSSEQPASSTKKKDASKTTEKTAQAPTLATTQGASVSVHGQPTTAQGVSQAPLLENGGYVTRNQERSRFKRICWLSWTELKRYRKNIFCSIVLHVLPVLVVVGIWAIMHFYLQIGSSHFKPHVATHIAAVDEFPLHGEKTQRVRVYFNESKFTDNPLLKETKTRFIELGKINGFEFLVKHNLLNEAKFNKRLSLFSKRNMSYLFHVTAASATTFEYELLTPELVLHEDLLPPQGPFAYPSSHDSIPLRDGYISEVAMLLNEAYKQIVHPDTYPPSDRPTTAKKMKKKRKHTSISPLFNYPIHVVLDAILYVHAALQILHVIRMVRHIVEEKQSGLKTLLRTMGISSKEYYVSHAVVRFVILMVNSLVLYIPVCQLFNFGHKAPVILGLLAYNMCMVMFGLMISTLFTASSGIGKIVFFMNIILHLETYLTTPSFSLSRGILTSLNFGSAFHYYMSSITHADVLGLPNPALLSDISTRMFGILALIMMLVDCLLLLLVLMYLSYVYPGGQERGAPWYFLLTNVFWSGAPRPRNIIDDQNWTRQAEASKRCIIYDGVDVESRLEAVSFECYVDQVLGIYGHKNSGRSTLLRLAAMIQKPDAGSVFIMEEDMVNMDHLNIIGFMDSTTAPLFDHLNVLEHMKLFARLRMSGEEEQLMAILRCLELDETARVSTLNASMKRRLQLGLAYTGGTKIMILDQPTEGCDLYTRTMIRDFIAANKAGRTTIGIFSSASETDALCDRIALIARGYVMSCGSLDWMITTFGGFTSVLTIYPQADYFTESQRTKLKSFFTDKLPDANIVVDVGHNFTVLVKNEMTEQIGEILAILDKNPESWGMSYAEVQRLTVERMYSMLDHSEATEETLKTDRAYVQEIERILTSPRYSFFSLVGCQMNVVAKRKMLFTTRFILNLFAQMTAFSIAFLLCLFLLVLFSQRALTPDMDIAPSAYPKMRFVGTKEAVKFAQSYDLKAEVLDHKKLEMDYKHSEWLFKYPAPLIGLFDEGEDVVHTMSMTTLRMGRLFAATLADNYRLKDKGKDIIKFKVVSMILTEKYANLPEFYGITKSGKSHFLKEITKVEEMRIVSGNWLVWLFTCFTLSFSLALCSLFPAYESASGILRKMRIPDDGTPTWVYWLTVAMIDLGTHLLLLFVFSFGFIYSVGPPNFAGFALIFLGWTGAFLSVMPFVYMLAAYVANPVKAFSIVMIGMLWLPYSVVATHYFQNFSFVAAQFALVHDSAVRMLQAVSPVHASALLTSIVPSLSGQDRYKDLFKGNGKLLFQSVSTLLLCCWVHFWAWLLLLAFASKSLRKGLSKMYYKITITEFNEPPEFNLPKQMAIANGGDEEDNNTVEGNTPKGRNKTARTTEEKGYDQLPGLKNRDIIIQKKELERKANNTFYDNLVGDPAAPHAAGGGKSMMKSIRRDKTIMGKLRAATDKTAKTVEDKKKAGEVEVEPGAVPSSGGPSQQPTSGPPPSSNPQGAAAAAAAAVGSPPLPPLAPTPPAKSVIKPVDSDKKKSFSKKSSKPGKDEKKEEVPLAARIGNVAESMKKVKPAAAAAAAPVKTDPPKTEEKKDAKKEETAKAAATPAPAAAAAVAASKKDGKKDEKKAEPAKPAAPAAPAAAAPAAAPKVDASAKNKAADKKEQPKTNPQDKDKTPATNLKAVEATRKDLIEEKKPSTPALATPTGKTPNAADATKETQGGTPVPTPKNTSKKRQGAGRDEESDDDVSDPDDVVVVRGRAGAETKSKQEKSKEQKALLPPQPKQYNALQTITQKMVTGPGQGTGVGADGMTTMARSRLTLSLHKPNEASGQRRMVKMDAPSTACEEDGVMMYDVYVNHKRSPQQFRLEGALTNIKKGSSVVVFGDATTSSALLDVLTGDAIATRGAIAIAGKAHEDARIASIRDHMALPDFLTVREHLEQTATSYGIRYMTIVDRLLELVGITDKEHWIIKDLQMPDRLLVSLCTALMNRPHLIVLDEPISALCPTSSLTMWYTLSIIRSLWGTVVMTQTRSPMEVEMLASHILLTQPRVVCDVLPPYDIKQRYLTQLFVRVALRQGADKAVISSIMISQLQAREYRTEARSEEVLSFVVELASRKLAVAFKQVCGFLLNLPVSFTVSTLPLDCAFESGGR